MQGQGLTTLTASKFTANLGRNGVILHRSGWEGGILLGRAEPPPTAPIGQDLEDWLWKVS